MANEGTSAQTGGSSSSSGGGGGKSLRGLKKSLQFEEAEASAAVQAVTCLTDDRSGLAPVMMMAVLLQLTQVSLCNESLSV